MSAKAVAKSSNQSRVIVVFIAAMALFHAHHNKKVQVVADKERNLTTVCGLCECK
jgi:hypothetical protein